MIKYIISLLIILLMSGIAFAGQEDLVVDGDFSETTAGSDLFVQEAYDTPLSLTWAINAGTPTINGQVIDFADEISSVIATSAWTTGKTYKVSVTVSSYAGTGNIILPYNGSTTYDQKTVAADGAYDYIIMVSAGSSPLIYSEAGHTATITVNYIKEVTTPGKGSFSGLTAGSSILDSGSPSDNTFYKIVERTGVDFTTIGAPNNTVGTSFYSTGTGVTLDSDDRLIELDTAWAPYGANLVEIVDDGTGWADCIEISYVDNAGGGALSLASASDLSSNLTLASQYLLTFDYKTSGTLDIIYNTGSALVGNETIISGASTGTWTSESYYVNSTNASTDAIIFANMEATEKIYLRNITITPVTLDNWTAGTGWGQTATSGAQVNSAYTIAATGDLEQDISAENDKIYHLTYTIADYAGTDTITPQIGGVNGTAKSANGTYTEDIAATGTNNLKFVPGGTDLAANILDVSVYSEVIIYVDGSYSGTETGSKTQPYNTIQEGINAAAGGDTVLVMAGTYTGAGNVELDYGGAPNGFSVICNTPLGCVIDGVNGNVRGAYFHNSETNTSEFSGFKITRFSLTTHGAGMLIASSPLIKNCWFDNNGSASGSSLGGGIAVWGVGSDSVIENCLFTYNKCGSSGGALYVHSGIDGLDLRNCTFTFNTAISNYPGIYSGKTGITIVNLISYNNVMAGMSNENYINGCTPTYSIYDYSETVGDTPGTGCIDSASTDPKFKDTSVFDYTPLEPLVYNGGSNIYSDTMYDIKGSEVVDSSGDLIKYMPIGCFNFGVSNKGWGSQPWGSQPWGTQPWGASLSGGQGVVVSYALLLDGAANFLNIDGSGHYLILN